MPDSSEQSPNALLSEVFSSLQGEGPLMGERHLFIRFSGCDIDCSYCDEDLKLGRKMALDEVLAQVDQLEKDAGPHSFVCLTGGEPLRQLDFLKSLLPELRLRGFKILLETSGVRKNELEEILEQCDAIAMDLKLSSVGGHQDFLEEHAKFLKIASSKETYIKIIISMKVNFTEFERHIRMLEVTAPDAPVFIQPVWEARDRLTDLLNALSQIARERLSDVRLGIQLHKMLGMP